ncbi:hypothetical protein [Adhaeretor mobilis]|uniref:Uncharacterized protein n=1 Tax=Adhaeretor mobilis TaxID=1930276 RepID=A0A517MXV7_9BACT|nr:hypothetical protein [Adhaeretor mobilis]QDS99657.1 hypothetical protein HG15A2_29840 [Adhaeretor mobilis]
MFDIESTKEALSLGGSLLALSSTAYFWLVRSNRERAQLQVHLVGEHWGNVPLPQEDPEAYQRCRPGEGEVVAKYGVAVATVNNSSLPNALLKVRAWLQLADDHWQECFVRTWQDPETSLQLPLNLSPLTTAGMQLTLSLKIRGDFDGGFQGRQESAMKALTDKPRVRIELAALQGKTFFSDLPMATSDTSEEAYRSAA